MTQDKDTDMKWTKTRWKPIQNGNYHPMERLASSMNVFPFSHQWFSVMFQLYTFPFSVCISMLALFFALCVYTGTHKPELKPTQDRHTYNTDITHHVKHAI